jgi:hypothetical protein
MSMFIVDSKNKTALQSHFLGITSLYHIVVYLSIPKLISYSVQFFIRMKTFHENFFIISCSNSLPKIYMSREKKLAL